MLDTTEVPLAEDDKGKQAFTLRLPSALYFRIRLHAAFKDISLNAYVLEALEKTTPANVKLEISE